MLKLIRNNSARTSDPSDMEPSRCGMNHGHMDIDRYLSVIDNTRLFGLQYNKYGLVARDLQNVCGLLTAYMPAWQPLDLAC
jgi:hypothetical protein